ncbi:hypothetical protein BDW74DRAFT_150706 [Aspergillus multicolor]|uniref:uncharacterized protein n=1 Tax=Aspergillus multicolor TaxID=41759 RepID=UPI003CCE333F
MNIAAADAQLLRRLTAVVEERDLLREQVGANPNLQELSRVRLENQRLQRENARLQRSLTAFTGVPASTENPPPARPASNSSRLPTNPADIDDPAENGDSPPASPIDDGLHLPACRDNNDAQTTRAGRRSSQTPVHRDAGRDDAHPTNQATRQETLSTSRPARRDNIIGVSHPGLPYRYMNIGSANSVEEFASNILTTIGLPVPEWAKTPPSNPYTQAPARPNNGGGNVPTTNPATLPAFAQPSTVESPPSAPREAQSAEPETAPAQQASQSEEMDWSGDVDNAVLERDNDDEDLDERMWDQ